VASFAGGAGDHRLAMLGAPSHSCLAYRPGVPLTAAGWREGRLAAARPRILTP
jgi:hypothetical protein